MSIEEDHYKPIITRGDFNGNYIQYESRGDKGKNLSIKKYLNMIRSYLIDIIDDHKTSDLIRYPFGNKTWVEQTPSEWKIHITIAINFVSSKDSGETRIMHTKSNDVEIMVGSETDEVIEELFESLLQSYQKKLEDSVRGSKFVYDSVEVMYYSLNKISLTRGGLYIDSPKCLKIKKATINPKNNDDKCF